jgi:hypothetical protein
MVCSSDLLTLAELQAFLQRGPKPPSRQAIHQWSIRGIGGLRLPCERIGRTRRWKRSDVEAWVQALSEGTAS